MIKNFTSKACIPSDAPPNSLRNPNVDPKSKQWKNKKVGALTLTWNTLNVGGHVRAPKWD